MHRSLVDVFNKVLVSCRPTFCTYTTATLSTELCEGGTLNVAKMADGNNDFIISIEVLCIKVREIG